MVREAKTVRASGRRTLMSAGSTSRDGLLSLLLDSRDEEGDREARSAPLAAFDQDLGSMSQKYSVAEVPVIPETGLERRCLP